MNSAKLITILPLAAALTISQAYAQGNPHLDAVDKRQQEALL